MSYAVFALKERTTPLYVVTLVDSAGDPLPDVTTLTLTWFDPVSGEIINSRSAQSIKNENQGTFSAGVVNWQMTVDDTVLLDANAEAEVRFAELAWTYGSAPVLTDRHIARFRIEGYPKTP